MAKRASLEHNAHKWSVSLLETSFPFQDAFRKGERRNSSISPSSLKTDFRGETDGERKSNKKDMFSLEGDGGDKTYEPIVFL